MALSLRRTGLSSPVFADQEDYIVIEGGKQSGAWIDGAALINSLAHAQHRGIAAGLAACAIGAAACAND
jgi:hypothetical protein